MSVVDTLRARGFFHQCSDEAGLREHLDSSPRTFYIGFDPTGDSLHVGHLVQLMVMAHLGRAGHDAIAVVGGGTAKVGDPSGKDATRELLDDARLEANKAAIAAQIARFCMGRMVDNADWLLQLNYIGFLRDIGRYFSVNEMVAAEGVKLRLDREQGLSFIEFNYVLLQSYDFLELYRRHNCTLQVGGGDQWYNIVHGLSLIRRVAHGNAFALTTPLLTTASGAKMGKTAAGAVWLDAGKLSPFDYRQYWYNCEDADVGRFLRLFTFLPIEEIDSLEHGDVRAAKKVLADEATAIVHGRLAAKLEDNIPTLRTAFPRAITDVLVESGLAASKGEARRFIDNGGVRIGDEKVGAWDVVVTGPSIVWVGKKRAVRVE